MATVELKRVRMSFPSLAEATASVEGGNKKFRAEFLLDPDTKEGKKQIKLMEEAIDEVMQDEWGKTVKLKEDRSPMGDGDDRKNAEEEVFTGYEGMKYVKAASKKRPYIVERDGETVIEKEDLEDEMYGGCYVNVVIELYAVSGKEYGGKGIFADLKALQKVKEGDRFGGGKTYGHGTFAAIDDDEDEDEDDHKSSKKSSKKDKKSEKTKKKSRHDDDDDEDEDDEDDRKSSKKSSKKDKKSEKTKKKSRDDDDEDDDEDEDEDDRTSSKKSSKKDKKSEKTKKKSSKKSRDDDDDDDDEWDEEDDD